MQKTIAVLLLLCGFFYGASCTCAVNAKSCMNKASDTLCEMAFADITQCENETFAQDVVQCRFTCSLCCQEPQFNCKDAADPLVAGDVNCTAIALAGMCRTSDAAYNAIMLNSCAGSCGLCLDPSGCPDKDPSICAQFVGVCKNVDYIDFLRDNCARTCGFECNVTVATTATTAAGGGATTASGTGTCVDIATNCAANTALCSNSIYYDLMTSKCAQTCGRCSGSSGGSSSTCVDSNVSCPTWVANGFCSATFYTDAQKRQYCGASCGLC